MEYVLNLLPEVAFFINFNFEIKWANLRAAEYLKVAKKELPGRYCYQLAHGLDAPCSHCMIKKAVMTGNVQIGEIETPDGEIWLTHLIPIQDKGILNLSKNISDKKRREQMEKELERQLIDMKKMVEGTVHALGKSVSARDPYTSGHQRQVAKLAVAIGEKMNLSEKRLNNLKFAALIHDIGKLRVPIEILTKPTSLTELEFQLIKTHPAAGYDILKDVNLPWHIAEFVRQHHERIDGTGYPDGLKGGEIHLESKIITVADVVEAMNSHRPYRPARGINEALKEVEQNKGILYAPEVVAKCLEIFEFNRKFLETGRK
ncbi:MAG: HD domain-containing phosphohydrolase [Halanaerobium sp.]|nr:HD domain-containing phosphohydrolase [Halanaerobium sp.]